jgi:hypothetical protein
MFLKSKIGKISIFLISGLCLLLTSKILMATNDYSFSVQQGKQVDCSGLNGGEHQFAFGLTSENRVLFCKKFTPMQRAAAMQLTSQPDPTGALISPDQAVVKVAEANNLTPATQNTAGCKLNN